MPQKPHNVRILDRFASSSAGRHGSRFCEKEGCAQTTREGKPYCPDHTGEHPYVQQILQTLADQQLEEKLVSKKGHKAVDLQGLNTQELMLHLEMHGSRTVERLSRDLAIDVKVLKKYVDALVRDGRVVLAATSRGNTVVRLIKKKPA